MTIARNRKGILLALGALGLGVLSFIALSFSGGNVPLYRGKQLTVWMESDYSIGSTSDDWCRAVLAVRERSFPTLYSMLKAHDSPTKVWLMRVMGDRTFLGLKPISAETKRRAACDAFLILGQTASNAVPALISIYERDASATHRGAVLQALAAIGPAAEAAVPSLFTWCRTDNEELFEAILVALTRIHAQPKNVVALLDMTLTNSSSPSRATAAGLLKAFGPEVTVAVPQLLKAVNDSDEQVRNAAIVTLESIAPDVVIEAKARAIPPTQ